MNFRLTIPGPDFRLNPGGLRNREFAGVSGRVRGDLHAEIAAGIATIFFADHRAITARKQCHRNGIKILVVLQLGIEGETELIPVGDFAFRVPVLVELRDSR